MWFLWEEKMSKPRKMATWDCWDWQCPGERSLEAALGKLQPKQRNWADVVFAGAHYNLDLSRVSGKQLPSSASSWCLCVYIFGACQPCGMLYWRTSILFRYGFLNRMLSATYWLNDPCPWHAFSIVLVSPDGGRDCPSTIKVCTLEVSTLYDQCLFLPGEVAQFMTYTSYRPFLITAALPLLSYRKFCGSATRVIKTLSSNCSYWGWMNRGSRSLVNGRPSQEMGRTRVVLSTPKFGSQ